MAQQPAEREKARLLRRRFESLTESLVGSALCDAYMKMGADVAQTSVLPWIRLADVAELLPDMALVDLMDNLKKIPFVRLTLRGHESMVKIVTTPPRKGIFSRDAETGVYDEIMDHCLRSARDSAFKSLQKIEKFEDGELKQIVAEAGALSVEDTKYLNTVKRVLADERDRLIQILIQAEGLQSAQNFR